MPYKIDVIGIYKIVNTVTNQCYVGQSQKAKKRLKEHFRLLKLNKHTNQKLQNSYNKHGASNFYGSIEIECQTTEDLDNLEELFLIGEAWFEEITFFNISDFAKAPMRGRAHSAEAKERIKLGRNAATFNYQSPEYRKTLSEAQTARFHSDPKFVDKIRFILQNSHMTYAARAKLLNADTSSVRRLAIKYQHVKGLI